MPTSISPDGTLISVTRPSSLFTRLSTIFHEMTMLAVAVVLPVALIMFGVAYPPHYDLKLIVGDAGKMGLYYVSHWRIFWWTVNTPAVSIIFTNNNTRLTSLPC